MNEQERLRAYHQDEELRSEAWALVSEGLTMLAQSRPSGDDSVYDYWPNGLACITTLYDSGYSDGIREMPEYFLQHLDESCGQVFAMKVEKMLVKLGFTIVVPSINTTWEDTYEQDQVDDLKARGFTVKFDDV